MSTVDWLRLNSTYFITDPAYSQGMQIYGKEKEVE